MATLDEMIAQYGGESRIPKPEQRTIWQKIKNEWPEFQPPRIPAGGLSLEWLWRRILLEDPTPPTAEEIAAEAAEEDRRYPEAHNAIYRRRHPDWLEKQVESAAECRSYWAWSELEATLDGRRGLSADRLAWLKAREGDIRMLIKDAKAEHRRRWPVGSPGLRGG